MDKIGKFEQGGQNALVFARRGFLAASGFGALTVGLSASVLGQTSTRADDSIPQPSDPNDAKFMERAFEMRQYAIDHGDQGYGAVVVRDNVIIGQSWSRVILDQDPTGHAEMAAIRDAARRLNDRDLSQAVMSHLPDHVPCVRQRPFGLGFVTCSMAGKSRAQVLQRSVNSKVIRHQRSLLSRSHHTAGSLGPNAGILAGRNERSR